MTSRTYNKPHKTKQPQQLNQLNPDTNKAAIPTHKQGRSTSRTPRPRTARSVQLGPGLGPLHHSPHSSTRSLRDRSTPLQSKPIAAAPRSHATAAPNHPIRRLQHHRSLLEVDRERRPRSDPPGDRSQARSAHTNSSKSFRQLIEGGTSSSTAPQLCPEHNPHRRGKEGEIEEGKSKPPYQPSRL
ncbi:hypothetical protein ACOSP7_006055 [Xanthoceras sorbifolium]